MQGVPAEMSSKIARVCLAVAMLRAGLVIRHRVLAKHWLLVIRLGVLPCLKEITTLATVTVSPAPISKRDVPSTIVMVVRAHTYTDTTITILAPQARLQAAD